LVREFYFKKKKKRKGEIGKPNDSFDGVFALYALFVYVVIAREKKKRRRRGEG
jgi:hypothetical protein